MGICKAKDQEIGGGVLGLVTTKGKETPESRREAE